MTEPTNPLFEDEKEFLERKKLEYERALRGDVEEIKENTLQIGKVALVGAGVVGGIWLLAKAFGGGKKKKHKKHKKHTSYFEDYADSGFEGFDEDDHEQELYDLTTAYNSPDYAYDHADRFGSDDSDGFYQQGDSGTYAYQSGAHENYDVDKELDDNGLTDYPDFPAHSSPQHGADLDTDTTYGSHASADSEADALHTAEDSGFGGDETTYFAPADSYQARPYDDSRRLPESDSFADVDTTEQPQPKAPSALKTRVVPAIVAFAKTETGKVIIAQAAAVAMAFVTKKVKDILPSDAAETGKNADLAASSAPVGVPPATWPATTAAQDVSAAAHHDDTISYREPLA